MYISALSIIVVPRQGRNLLYRYSINYVLFTIVLYATSFRVVRHQTLFTTSEFLVDRDWRQVGELVDSLIRAAARPLSISHRFVVRDHLSELEERYRTWKEASSDITVYAVAHSLTAGPEPASIIEISHGQTTS